MAGVGGRSGPAIPPNEAGRTQRAEMQWRTPAQPGLRHAAAGSKGSDAHLRQIECRRPTPQRPGAVTAAHQRAALFSSTELHNHALSKPVGRRGGVRAQLCASRRRALRPDRVCHAENQRDCGPWRLRRSPPAHAHQISRSAAGRARLTSADRNPNGQRRRRATRRRPSGVERGHAARDTPWHFTPRTANLRQSYVCARWHRTEPS